MPWRGQKDPYHIWLSEIIMHQTRFVQGTPYYLHFIKTYPDVHALAEANQEQVLKSWEGLGYYSRARNLHKAAQMISREMNGVFPKDYKDLLALPGVGPYTAAAIASICYGESVAVVDGNVDRLISRLYHIEVPVNKPLGKAMVREHAQAIVDVSKSPAEANQAMMEFGAMQCIPKNPDCMYCVLSAHCIARSKGKEIVLPIKQGKTKVRDRYFHYHVIMDEGHTYIQQRKEKSIWEGLYQFPLVEHKSVQDIKPIVKHAEALSIDEATHVLSHQRIHARFVVYEGRLTPAQAKSYDRIAIAALKDYPLARITTRWLELGRLED